MLPEGTPGADSQSPLYSPGTHPKRGTSRMNATFIPSIS